jgi:hypothetical protein
MKRIFNIARNHLEAMKYDKEQYKKMTPEERQKIAFELKRRFFGDNTPDVRQSGYFNIK